ncbi:hypothetical protein J2S00_003878 [Caldalkalibacillus uzonensis]|uniref:NAD-dependent epimerase/dehydratase family protein n=1 Tax=Caldalkalibacillus uzonensis TaxID=353224 RepID=A0ABU0CY26_9BACI|nr:hypothetical protein [Caldalkalibacillus uzonensis]
MNKHVPLRGKFQTFTGEFLVDDFEEFKNDVDTIIHFTCCSDLFSEKYAG